MPAPGPTFLPSAYDYGTASDPRPSIPGTPVKTGAASGGGLGVLVAIAAALFTLN